MCRAESELAVVAEEHYGEDATANREEIGSNGFSIVEMHDCTHSVF